MRVVSYCIAAVGTVVTLVAMAHGGGGLRSLLSGFTIWALVPYAGFAAASAIARTRASLIAAFAVGLTAVLFGSFMYLNALFVHISSTSALVFVFIPLYQLLAAVVVVIFAAECRKHATRKV